MHPQIAARFNRLEQGRQAFLQEINALSVAQQRFKPAPGAWCALEVAEHVLRVELGLSERWLTGAALAPVTWRSRLLGWAMVAGLRTPVRLKTPSRAADPQDVPTPEDLERRWRAHRERMRAHLEPLAASALALGATHHPMVKPLTLAQTLGFFKAHLRHHQYQLERIRRAPDFPQPA